MELSFKQLLRKWFAPLYRVVVSAQISENHLDQHVYWIKAFSFEIYAEANALAKEHRNPNHSSARYGLLDIRKI